MLKVWVLYCKNGLKIRWIPNITYNIHSHINLKLQLDGQGRARREAARRRKSKCEVNLLRPHEKV